MSYMSSLINRNRTAKVTKASTPTQAGATSIMVTLSPWPSFATLKTIKIVGSNQINGTSTVTVYSNDATGLNPVNVTGTMVSNNLVLSFSDLYVEDQFRTGCLYVKIANGTITTGTVFTVTAEGTELAPYTADDNDHTCFLGDQTWKVLTYDTDTSICLDITTQVLRNGNPWGQGAIDQSQSVQVFGTANEYLYIGSVKPWTNTLISIPAAYRNILGATFKHWNGSAWVTASVSDNTSDGQAAPSTFSYTGVLSVTSWSGAVPYKLPFDPQTVYETYVDNFTTYPPTINPGGFWYNPVRYWLQINVPTLATPIKVVGIQPVR